MGDIIDLSKKEPHLSGKAICRGCGHEFVAVVPVGTVDFDCPECGANKAIYKNFVFPDTDLWQCNCGNDLFVVTKGYFMCIQCGETQNFE